jgi:hypothetical protein
MAKGQVALRGHRVVWGRQGAEEAEVAEVILEGSEVLVAVPNPAEVVAFMGEEGEMGSGVVAVFFGVLRGAAERVEQSA